MVKRKSMPGRCVIAAGACMLAGLLVACDPRTPEDRAFFAEREKQRANRETLLRGANERVDAAKLLDMVQQSAAPDGQGTTLEWLNRQLDGMGGQIMFPRWISTRPGSNRQEIEFNFIFIDPRNNMKRMAYRWDVDVLQMDIRIPQLIELEDIASKDDNLVQQRERRIRAYEAELE